MKEHRHTGGGITVGQKTVTDDLVPNALVLLTGEGPEHRYVTAKLAAAFPVSLRAIILASSPAMSMSARWRRYRRRYTRRQIISRIMARSYAKITGRSRRRAAGTRVLFPEGDTGVMPRKDLLHVVDSHNGQACLTLLDRIAPELIAVYGTGVIREGVIRAARRAIFNLHTGLSPRYRGADSVFWALHNGEPEWIGATIHLLNAHLDAGPILTTGRPNITRDDNEETLFFKTVAVGADLYVEALRAFVRGTTSAESQHLDQGREYRFVERTVAAERRLERRLRAGLLRGYPPS
jgi:folate-dependent phosphoribosylglycinamide formyltransferase PurN